jgi:hypothetical protein
MSIPPIRESGCRSPHYLIFASDNVEADVCSDNVSTALM